MDEKIARPVNMNCDSPRTVHTIGHSTRTIQEVIELLNAHAIRLLIDVRRWPASRRYPHFNRKALAATLEASRIAYFWRQDLGGFRKLAPDSPNTAWRVAPFRAYADFMLTPQFEAVMKEIEAVADQRRIVLMCAEAAPWLCHRQLLADAFLVRGWTVRHIMVDACREHTLAKFAEVDGTRIVYSGSGAEALKQGEFLF